MPALKTAGAVEVKLKSVLVATDFSPTSEKAVRHAVALARRYQAKVYLLHVVSSFGFSLVGPEAVAMGASLATEEMRCLEQQLVSNGMFAGIEHEGRVRLGDISDELAAEVREHQIDLVVVGTHSRMGLAKMVLGSVAERVFRNSDCLVLTVGYHCPEGVQFESAGPVGPLLFATDFSEASLHALPYAVSFANEQRTRLVLLHLLAPVPLVKGDVWYTAADVVRARNKAQSHAIEKLAALVSSLALEFPPLCKAEFADPAEGILSVATKLRAEAIVLGLRRTNHATTASHLPWSTAYEVVCGAECPVLTVRS